METIICYNCPTEVPERGFFCPSCATQVKCKECKAQLEPNSNACINCGALVGERKSNEALNTIEFKEGKEGRSFKASFTDTVGSNISESFNMILSNKLRSLPPTSNLNPSKDLSSETEDIESEEIKEVDTKLPPKTENSELEKLRKIFRFEDDKIELIEPRLKATSNLDYARRLSLLYIYAHKISEKGKAKRKELNAALDMASVYSASYRDWIANTSEVINGELLDLKLPGIENVKKNLNEILDSEVENNWMPGYSGRPKKNKGKQSKSKDEIKSSESKERKKAGKGENYSLKIMAELNLYPKDGKDSINDFTAKYSLGTGYANNLLFVYYLKEILKLPKVSLNHIYTCYRNSKSVKLPAFPMSIYKTKYKGWIKFNDLEDIIPTTAGINHVELKLKKKGE